MNEDSSSGMVFAAYVAWDVNSAVGRKINRMYPGGDSTRPCASLQATVQSPSRRLNSTKYLPSECHERIERKIFWQ